MRTVFVNIFIVTLLSAQTGISAQECEKDISTNPNQPFNNHPFPQGRYNPWLNSDFNIGGLENGNVPPMPLNNQIGWQISDFVFGSAFEMWNPYTSAGTAGPRYSYLHPTGIDFEYLDYKWADGWEVLHIGMGFYPNGEAIQTPNAQRAFSSGVNQASNTKVPYIILYNRYRGTLRVFMNLFTPFGGYSDIHVWLKFDDESPSGLSGILRHLEPFDRPLDQTTNVKRHESFNPNSGGSSRWFSADFQMGYDPCICGKNQKWKISLRGIESFDVNLSGRGVTVEMPISDGSGNPNYDVDWLSSNGLQDGLTGGNQIFTKMEGLVEDYKDAMDKYEQDSREYADYVQKKAVMDAFQGFIVDGISGLVPAGGALKSWFVKPKEGDPGNFANYIKGASKGLLGYGYDQLSMGINPKASEPKAPDMPTASYSEMRFEGTITGTSQEETIGPFFIPGSYDESSALSNLDPFNYPSYNAPVGISALVQTPSPLVYFDTEIDYSSNHSPSEPCEFCPPTQVKYETKSEFEFRFEHEFVIALNPSLDFDMDRTATYVQLEVTLENDYTANNVSEIGELTIPLNFGGPYPNLSFERFIQEDDHQIKVYQSKWVLIEDLNQYVFSLNTTHQLDFLETYCLENFENGGCLFATCVPAFEQFCLDNGADPQPFHPDQLKYRLANVKMKVLHDYFFEQIATNGDQVNTTQVFAYELFNQEEDINLIGDAVELQNNQNSFGAYIPGQMFLGYEIITPDNPVVHEVIGNEIFVNGQDILI